MRGAENETAGDTFSGAGRADVKFTKEYHPKPTRRPGFTATTEYASSWPSAIAGGFACFGGVDASVYHAARLETRSFRTQIGPEPHGGAYGEKKRHFAEESAFHDARAAFMDGRFRGDGSLIKTNRASPTYAGDARGGIFPGGRGNVRPEGMGVGVTLLCRAGASVLPRSRLSRRDRFPLCAGDPGARGPSRRPSRQAPRRHAREPAVPHHERP